MKFTLSEINNNPQETNKEGKEARIQINDLEHKKNKHSTRTEKRIKNSKK